MEFENTIIYIVLLITIVFLFYSFLYQTTIQRKNKGSSRTTVSFRKSISELIVRHLIKWIQNLIEHPQIILIILA